MRIPFATLRLAAIVLLLAAVARAAPAGFVEGLSAAEQARAGLNRLSDSERAVLDGLVARDVRLAHEGGVTGFSTTFLARHSPAEESAAGLQKLAPAERAALDNLAARSIAIGPAPDDIFSYSPPAVPPPPSPTAKTVSDPLRAEVHGDLSVMVGGGSHGRSFYGTAGDLTVTDPSGKFTVGVGFEQFRGKGLLGVCSDYGPYSPYGPWDPALVGPPYLGW
jgi:hypothetical protein